MTKLVRTERKIMHLVLECIAEMDERQIYLERAYSSLYDFLISEFGYSSSAAYRRMEGARMLREVPEVAKKVESGALNLSQISMVRQAVRTLEKSSGERFTTEKKKEILGKIEFMSQKKTEQVLHQTYDAPVMRTAKEQCHRDDSVSLTINFSKDQMVVLTTARNLVDHAISAGGWADAITYFAKNELKKRGMNEAEITSITCETPLLNLQARATGAPVKTSKAVVTVGAGKSSITSVRRPPISSALRRKILHGRSCCEFLDRTTGRLCNSQRFLQIDHIQPVWAGGTDDESNLRVLCGFHNRFRYENSQ